ncbi:divergent polysaccharide deacetylase family protein [Thalassospiraceae bacterium LMO-SO8]|nr:divergent polysaccharide deacetylase family protein [Alphaproteobacteria bacterium LMO-S08]WND76646.1 divergent polysaccharide deacetylase family protein [Thalassospiraceae bacterium LMO-SO8]
MPSIKLPSIKMPSLKRKKRGDDDEDDEEEFDLDEGEDEEDDDAYGDDDDDDEEEGSAWERMDPQRKVLIISALAGGLLLTSIFGGAAYFLLGSSDPEPVAERQRPDGSIAIPTAQTPGGGLTPPGENAAPPAGEGSAAPGATGAAAPGTTSTADQVVGGITASQVALQNEGTGGLAAATAPGGVGQDPDHGRVIPFATAEAYKGIAWIEGVEALARVPDLALVEKGPDGRDMPIVARNGTRPMDAYARPVADADASIPQIAILIRGIGLSRTASITAIKSLPPEVSMVVSPYARDPGDWVIRARLAGHEVFMGLPMESANFPFEDAGPLALNTNKQVEENMRTLRTLMGMVPGYVGFLARFGSKFGVAEGQLKPVFEEIKSRGLMFIDSGESGSGAMARIATEMALPKAMVDIHLDRTPTEDEIASKLLRLGALARSQSVAVGMGDPYPHTIRELKNWLAAQSPTKLRLVPVSAVADRQITQ